MSENQTFVLFGFDQKLLFILKKDAVTGSPAYNLSG